MINEKTEKIYKLYGGAIVIRFVDPGHQYWLIEQDGKTVKPMKRLTGVTSFTGAVIDKSNFLIPWALDLTSDYLMEHKDELKKRNADLATIFEDAKAASAIEKERAADIGKAVHAWIESHVKGEKPDMPEDPKVLQGVNAFIGWVEENGAKFLWTERVVYSRKFGYVGTADVGLHLTKGPYKGKKPLGDWKVSNGLYPAVQLQTAGYQGAIVEENPKEKFDGRLAVRISSETEEEYTERMEKKWARKGYTSAIPPFQQTEQRYFPQEAFKDDLRQAMNAWEIIQWNRRATQEFRNGSK